MDSQVELEGDNSRPFKAHIPSSDKGSYWRGQVIQVKTDHLKPTGTDFCALLQRSGREFKPTAYDELSYKKPNNLLLAHIKVTFPQAPAMRKLEAARKFAKSSTVGSPTALDCVRLAFISQPSNTIHIETDLRRGVPETDDHVRVYEENLQKMKHLLANDVRFQVTEDPAAVLNAIQMIIGPPGIDKTEIMSLLAWALVQVGHKLLLTAPSNGAIDQDTNSVWKDRPDSLRYKKVLRLEIGGLEKSALLATGQDAYDNAQYADRVASEVLTAQHLSHKEDLAWQNMHNKVVQEFCDTESDLTYAAMEDYDAQSAMYQEAWEKLQSTKEKKISNVPSGTSSGWHVAELRR